MIFILFPIYLFYVILCYIRNQLIIFYAWIHLERNNAWKTWSLLLIEYEYSIITFSLNDIKELRRFHLIFLWSAFHLLKISVNTSMRALWWNFFFLCVFVRAQVSCWLKSIERNLLTGWELQFTWGWCKLFKYNIY